MTKMFNSIENARKEFDNIKTTAQLIWTEDGYIIETEYDILSSDDLGVVIDRK